MSQPEWPEPFSGVESKPPLAQSEFPYPCTWEGCHRGFMSAPARNTHIARIHKKGWSTTGNLKNRWKKKGQWKSDDPEYRKQKYREQVKRWHAAGLTAQGKPFKNSAVSRGMRKAIANRKKQELLNGAANVETVPATATDNLGDSARAIIMAAQVLRAVSLGMKL